MKNYTTSLFTFLFITIIVPCGFSQTDESNEAKPYKKSYWFDIGGGWGGQGSAFNIGFSYELVPKRLISIRYSSVWTNDHCDEIAFIIPIENPIGKSGDSFEVSYGLLKKGKIGMVNASAGLSLVKVETAGGDGPSTQSTPPFFYTDCPDD